LSFPASLRSCLHIARIQSAASSPSAESNRISRTVTAARRADKQRKGGENGRRDIAIASSKLASKNAEHKAGDTACVRNEAGRRIRGLVKRARIRQPSCGSPRLQSVRHEVHDNAGWGVVLFTTWLGTRASPAISHVNTLPVCISGSAKGLVRARREFIRGA
jgi:hypothetical protein